MNKISTTEGINAWEEAEKALEEQPTRKELEWSEGLTLAAQDHCIDMETSGRGGHIGTDGSQAPERVERYGKLDGGIGETIAYGKYSGEDFMLHLYIDDGKLRRGNRFSITSPEYRQTGIAYCKHNVYEGVLVILYAHQFQVSPRGRKEIRLRN